MTSFFKVNFTSQGSTGSGPGRGTKCERGSKNRQLVTMME